MVFSSIEPATHFDPPSDYPDDCIECGEPCREDAELCATCLRDAEHDAKGERDE